MKGGRWVIVDERSKRGKGAERRPALLLVSSVSRLQITWSGRLRQLELYLACEEEYEQEG